MDTIISCESERMVFLMFVLDSSLKRNEEQIKNILRLDKNFDIIYKEMTIDGVNAGFVFIDGFIDGGTVQRILQYFYGLKKDEILESGEAFARDCIPYVEVDVETDGNTIIANILSGMVGFFIDGVKSCIMLDCREYPARGVDEPWKDKVLRGSRDGFVETLVFNVALIRRRVKDPQFSTEIFRVGERSKSDVAICYIEDKADLKLVSEIKKRLQTLKVEALTMNVESLAECLLKGKWINPFPKFKYSERPDTAAAAVMDGNIVVMVDNSPAVMILPTSVFDVLEEADDFYFPPVVGTYIRLSRFLITLVAVFLTPVWVMFLNNPEIVPEWLEFILITDDITVPVLWQLLILEIAVDGLRLAAVNTPQTLSTPLSVVAGIVVGEFAVTSGWFNSESMLYMAFISVATYSQASFEMGYALKFCRVMTLILTAVFDWWGLIAGAVISLIMVCTNTTISGKSYIYPIIPWNSDMVKRKILRLRLPHKYEEE